MWVYHVNLIFQQSFNIHVYNAFIFFIRKKTAGLLHNIQAAEDTKGHFMKVEPSFKLKKKVFIVFLFQRQSQLDQYLWTKAARPVLCYYLGVRLWFLSAVLHLTFSILLLKSPCIKELVFSYTSTSELWSRTMKKREGCVLSLTVPGLVKSVLCTTLCLIWLLNRRTHTLCRYSGEICKSTAHQFYSFKMLCVDRGRKSSVCPCLTALSYSYKVHEYTFVKRILLRIKNTKCI